LLHGGAPNQAPDDKVADVRQIHDDTPIEADHVRGLLITACPELASAFAQTDKDNFPERLTYSEISAVVRWLAARVKQAGDACMPAIFDVAERCLRDGTGQTRTLITVGLFEDLQNDNLTDGLSWDTWERHLGPLSRSAWNAIAAFWQGDITALPRLFAEHGWTPPDWEPPREELDRLRRRERPRGEIGT
jgi:hypothetical protein